MKKEIRLNNLSEDKKMTPQEMKNLKGGSGEYGQMCRECCCEYCMGCVCEPDVSYDWCKSLQWKCYY